MTWLRNIALDLLVTALIAFSVWKPGTALIFLLTAYTIIIALLKLGVLFSESLLRLAYRSKHAAPPIAFHLLYSTNLVLSAYAERWWWVALWGFIWITSLLGQRKVSQATVRAGKMTPQRPSRAAATRSGISKSKKKKRIR